MKQRTLSIRRECLGELTDSELTAVAGASGLACDVVTTVATTKFLTGICPTWDCTGCYLTCGC
jgi:hypothetical protein